MKLKHSTDLLKETKLEEKWIIYDELGRVVKTNVQSQAEHRYKCKQTDLY